MELHQKCGHLNFHEMEDLFLNVLNNKLFLPKRNAVSHHYADVL